MPVRYAGKGMDIQDLIERGISAGCGRFFRSAV